MIQIRFHAAKLDYVWEIIHTQVKQQRAQDRPLRYAITVFTACGR